MLPRVTRSYNRSLFGICRKCVPKSQFLTCIKGKKRIPKISTSPAIVGGAAPGATVAIKPIAIKPLAIKPLAGGVTSPAITPKTIDEAKKVLEDIKKSTRKTPLALKDKNAKLEYFSSQVVSGTNYTLVYKINKSRYQC